MNTSNGLHPPRRPRGDQPHADIPPKLRGTTKKKAQWRRSLTVQIPTKQMERPVPTSNSSRGVLDTPSSDPGISPLPSGRWGSSWPQPSPLGQPTPTFIRSSMLSATGDAQLTWGTPRHTLHQNDFPSPLVTPKGAAPLSSGIGNAPFPSPSGNGLNMLNRPLPTPTGSQGGGILGKRVSPDRLGIEHTGPPSARTKLGESF